MYNKWQFLSNDKKLQKHTKNAWTMLKYYGGIYTIKIRNQQFL